MPTAEQQVVYGSYVSDGVARNINPGFIPHEFHTWNETQQDSVANPSVNKETWYLNGLAANSAYTIRNTAGLATDEHQLIAAGGYRIYTGVEEVLDAAVVGTALTNATPAVATSAAHGYAVGDIVRIYTTTGMLQVAGLDFVITVVGGAGVYTLGTLGAVGFLAAATAITARRVFTPRAFEPGARVITDITAANPGVITTNINHFFQTGDRVRIIVPPISGMVELNNQLVTVTRLTATTFSIGVDTIGFTAFAWPTSVQAAAGVLRPQVIPVGDTGQDLSAAMDNTSFQGIHVGALVCGANNDLIRWRATRGVT